MLLTIFFFLGCYYIKMFLYELFSNSLAEKNYSPIALYMKPTEETQLTTELLQVISLYSIDWTVSWCLHHVKASLQSLDALEDISVSVLA